MMKTLRLARCNQNYTVPDVLRSIFDFAVVEHVADRTKVWSHLFVKDAKHAEAIQKKQFKYVCAARPEDLKAHILAGRLICFLFDNQSAQDVLAKLRQAFKEPIEYSP